MIKGLLDLLYPPKCAFCREILEKGSEEALCSDCRKAWEKEKAEKCRICGRKHSACVCDQRRMGWTVASFHLIGYTNRSAVGSRLVLVNKDRHLEKVSDFLASELADAMKNAVERERMLVTYCPRKDASRRNVGYDHAEMLARSLAAKLNLPFEPLILRQGGDSQKGLSYLERRKNAEKAYAFDPSKANVMLGKTVIVVDDVSTTGATLDRCAVLLRKSGAAAIVYAYIAKSNRGMGKKT